MFVRRIKNKERRRAGNLYCPYCKPVKVDAVWRIAGWYDMSRHIACDTHKQELDKFEDSGHYTEADYQTWMRL